MSLEQAQKPIFFSIRKNVSYFMWRPYGEFFDFKSVCIEAVSEEEFAVYGGSCVKVQELGRKRLVSATRYRKLKNGIYILAKEEGGKYVFRLIKPLQRNV
jgi:hypothetical protein